jgi:hypothetical protein
MRQRPVRITMSLRELDRLNCPYSVSVGAYLDSEDVVL